MTFCDAEIMVFVLVGLLWIFPIIIIVVGFFEWESEMSRTRKHPLTGANRFAPSCRNHGDCPWCKGNRTYNERRDKEKADFYEKELKSGEK